MSLNIVPTPHTKRIAKEMTEDARKETPFDSVIQHFWRVRPNQYPALIALLLGYRSTNYDYTPAEQREAHRRHYHGDRTAWVVQGEREYQRASSARRRARAKEAS